MDLANSQEEHWACTCKCLRNWLRSFVYIYCKFIMVRSSLLCSHKSFQVNIVAILLIVFRVRHNHPTLFYLSLWQEARENVSPFPNESPFSEAGDRNLIITQHIQLLVLKQFRIIFCFFPKSKVAAEFKWEGCPPRKYLHMCNIFQLFLQIKRQIGIYYILMCPVVHSNIVFSWINYQKCFFIIIDYYIIEKYCTADTWIHLHNIKLLNNWVWAFKIVLVAKTKLDRIVYTMSSMSS